MSKAKVLLLIILSLIVLSVAHPAFAAPAQQPPGTGTTSTSQTTSSASSTGSTCKLSNSVFFVVPPWWEYLKGQTNTLGECQPVFSMPGDLWLVGLAILDMLLRLAGFLAVVSIIIAGIEYIIATGNPERISNARRRIIYSLSGLAVAMAATATVAFVGRVFGG